MFKKMKWLLGIGLVAIVIATIFFTKMFFESNEKQTVSAVVEQISNLNELTTAEAYTKVVIERENNKLFGKEISVDFPGTKQNILVVIPGHVKSGVDLSGLTAEDVKINEEKKTIELTIPKPKIMGEPSLELTKVKVFSSEGLFRDEATVKEGYSLANEAQEEMVKEAVANGLLEQAAINAKKSLKDMFSLVNYKATITIK
ncbi:DUF4230 domain-containing protein [Kurthia sibirica]|uniref:DUF4230 domain-containing protein n=1 Tax=Kurthia sibirica TaxID=202750 RepID=UPI00117581EF|nr:DUF4230 domain-containing protein [Kurthia sibirica]GEK35051.1 hypothetical protein KSI01_25840 [Kurthia sibirica]